MGAPITAIDFGDRGESQLHSHAPGGAFDFRRLAHDLLDAIDGFERSSIHLARGFSAITLDQRGHGKLHAGEDHAAVARTGTPAESFGF